MVEWVYKYGYFIKTAIHKYEFFTDFKATPKVISNAKAKHPDVEIVKFIDTK